MTAWRALPDDRWPDDEPIDPDWFTKITGRTTSARPSSASATTTAPNLLSDPGDPPF
ncbi:hypothetical protein [Actinomycetospora cinnamomea]|uniref:Uncharacterized protein n=1 Tax=Actinomycetospora cinnamomea TaxID=663609 RepID=A0A2U1F7J5_9PSEU|nr:hypothetical protein [Actinomycetospora cinnamomea]PVZ08119.1 hypothetical protein C8D89_1092 [Actinomycetospora cinnamomea]